MVESEWSLPQHPIQALLRKSILAEAMCPLSAFQIEEQSVLGENSHVSLPRLARSEERKQLCPGVSLMSGVVERITVSHKELAIGLHQCPQRTARVRS